MTVSVYVHYFRLLRVQFALPAIGELDPTETSDLRVGEADGTGLRVCYGLRLVESRSCAYS